MISTRFKRGAIRTHLLIRKKLESYNSKPLSRSVLTARSLGLSLIAMRMALPVPVAAAPSPTTLLENTLDSEPPSMVRIDERIINTIIITPTVTDSEESIIPLSIKNTTFNPIEIGESNASLNAEEQQRIEAENAQKEKEEQEKAARQDAERKAKERLAAAKRKAQEQVRVLAAVPVFSGDARALLQAATIQAFGEQDWPAMSAIVSRESGFNPNSFNSRSGACGLFQALPCSKMGGMEVNNQIRWGIGYIRARYGNPTNAWNFWLSHHWY